MRNNVFFILFFLLAQSATAVPLQYEVIHDILIKHGFIRDFSDYFVEKLPGGSLAEVYKISTTATVYVLRKINKSPTAIQEELYMLQYASNHGFGPRLFYSDPVTGIALMEFIEQETLSMSEKLKFGIGSLKKLHSMNTFPFTPPSLFEKIITESEVLKEDTDFYLYATQIMEYAKKIMLFLNEFPKVISHNDFHGGNLLFTCEAAYLIDFESIAYECYLYDIATVFAEIPTTSVESHIAILQEYLGPELEVRDLRCYRYCQALRMLWMAVVYIKKFDMKKVEQCVEQARWYIDTVDSFCVSIRQDLQG